MIRSRGLSFGVRSSGGRKGWFAVALSLLVNLVLFWAVAFVNRAFQPSVDAYEEAVPVDLIYPAIDEMPAPSSEVPSSPVKEVPREVSTACIAEVPRLKVAVPLLPRVSFDSVVSDTAWPSLVPDVVEGLVSPMDSAAVDEPPRKLFAPPLRYPSWAKAAGLEGVVTVEFVVEVDGRVGNVRVVDVKGDRRFGEVVAKAVKMWRFSPGMYGGRKVPVRCVQRVRFCLEG